MTTGTGGASAVDDDRAAALRRRLLTAAILASFVSFLDGTIVTVALPSIADEVGGGVVTQQWVVDGYLLALSALMLLAGAVTDAFGRLRVLRIALVAFAITSLLCAIAPTAGVLIAARVLQGAAGALLVPGSLGLIIAVFSGEAQARAIGTWTSWTSVATLAGPVAGGLLVDAIGWRSVFVLSVLPAAGAMLLLGRERDEARTGPRQRIDVPSALLTAAGLGGLTAGLIELGAGSDAVVPVGAAWALLGGGVVCLAGFLLRNARTDHPLVPPGLFAARNFAAGNGTTLFVYGGLGLASLVPTLYMQEVVGLSATVAALVGLPATLLLVLLSSRFGALAGRYGPRPFMTVGPLIAAGGAALGAFVTEPRSALAFIVPSYVLVGLGLAVTVAPLTAAVLGAVPPAQSGIGSAVNNAIARVAGLIVTACVGWILAGAVSTPGFVRSSLVTAALLLVGAAVSYMGIRGRTAPDPDR